MNYYRFYVGDYLKDTSKLKMLEHGAYCLLLHYYYAEEAPLPLDREDIYTMVRAMKPDQRQAVDKVLDIYFHAEDDGYHNNRADEELGIASKAIEAAKENGKLGGRPKKQSKTEPDGNPENNPVGFSEQCGSESQSEPTNNHPPTTNHQPPAVNLQEPAANPQPPEVKNKAPAARASRPETVDQGVWNDFIQLRIAKKAPLTVTALKGIEAEASKAGLTLQAALEISCKRGWQGFEAAWLNGTAPAGNAAAFASAKQKLFGTPEKDITHDSERI